MFYHDVGGCFNALYRVHHILLIKIFLLLLLLLSTCNKLPNNKLFQTNRTQSVPYTSRRALYALYALNTESRSTLPCICGSQLVGLFNTTHIYIEARTHYVHVASVLTHKTLLAYMS